MSRAAERELDALHGVVATILKDAITPEVIDLGEGKKKVVYPSPQMIAQAIKFLKDNGIDAPAKSKRMSDLASALDDLDTDDAAMELHH